MTVQQLATKMRDFFCLDTFVLTGDSDRGVRHRHGRKDLGKTGEARTVFCFRYNINVEPKRSGAPL